MAADNTLGLQRLALVMNQLRSPGGCPWDAEQTHESLLQYLIEETYETIDAVENGNRADLLEELGDVLLQVFFHARIAEEHPTEPFDINDVAEGIADKLVRRHPHVFPDDNGALIPVDDAQHVEARWQALKASEKSRTSSVDGVPVSMPPISQLTKLLTRTKNANLDPPLPVLAIQRVQQLQVEGLNLTDVIVAIVAVQKQLGIDPEQALRSRVAEFRAEIQAQEAANRAN